MSRIILIIGANSALAKDVIPVLAQKNTIVTAGKNNCDVYCDVTEDVTIPDGVEVVINFAAAFGGKSDDDILNAYKTNVAGALNVCMAAKKADIKYLINISSIFSLLDEASPYYSIYSVTKKHADELTQLYCKINEVPFLTLRPSQIYGDNDSFSKHQPFFYQIINKVQNGQDVSIYGKNDPLRNYIHSADLAEVISRAVELQVKGVYPCAYPEDVSYSQVSRAAQKVFNKGGSIVFEEDKADIPNNIFTKDVSLYEAIGYYPQISIETGIQRIKDYREKSLK